MIVLGTCARGRHTDTSALAVAADALLLAFLAFMLHGRCEPHVIFVLRPCALLAAATTPRLCEGSRGER